jgi:SsrA-binding protein
MPEEFRVIATNRKARHDYTILDTDEAGIVLTGSEIKSIRAGHVSLREGYITVHHGELWLLNVHIAAYDQAGVWSHDPLRPRKLLMHRRQIDNLASLLQEKGYTIVPLRLYFKGKVVKVELGLARGKRQYDKRRAIAAKDEERKLRREWKEFSKHE